MFGARRNAVEARQIKGKWFASSMMQEVALSNQLKPGHDKEAMGFNDQMQEIITTPTTFAFVEVLKECGRRTALEQGHLAHFGVVENGFDLNLVVNNALITLYSRCICLQDALIVFHKMSERDAVTWNAMIGGYAKHGHGLMVLHFFYRMRVEGLQLDNFTYVSAMKACASVGSSCLAHVLHTLILAGHVEGDVYIGSALVYMYANCCSLPLAYKEFCKLSNRNVVTWNAMITGCTEHGQEEGALQVFKEMQQQLSVQPNDVTFISMLKSTSNLSSFSYGQLLHAFILECELEFVVMVGTTLIDMYVKCGSLEDAQDIFKAFSKASLVTWSAMIAGYADHGHNMQALELFEEMQSHSLTLNDIVYTSVLKACSQLHDLDYGFLIHAHVVLNACKWEKSVGNPLISMYVSCGNLLDARLVFDRLSEWSVVTWSSMIAGHAEYGCGGEALALFQQMIQQGEKPNSVTFLSALRACSSMGSLFEGKLLHVLIIESGFGDELVVANTMVDMYAKCGSMDEALELFSQLPKHCVSTWNALISGYMYQSNGWAALKRFQSMLEEGVEPNSVTFTSTLRGCCCLSALEDGMLIHHHVLCCNEDKNRFVQSALVHLYAKHGSFEDSQMVFDQNKKPDLVPCNALMTAYALHARCLEAVELFRQMEDNGIKPDTITLVGLLQACSLSTALAKGRLIHAYAMKGAFPPSVILKNALINMYTKCGSVNDARKVFDTSANRDLVSWTAMISGYVLQNDFITALYCLDKMQEEGIKPNEVTYLTVLSACSHIGFLSHASFHMKWMMILHGITPMGDHYNTLVGFLGCVGRLLEAQDLVQVIPFRITMVGWASLLAHCNTHGNVKLGHLSFDQFITFDSRHAFGYMKMAVLSMHEANGSPFSELRHCVDNLKVCKLGKNEVL